MASAEESAKAAAAAAAVEQALAPPEAARPLSLVVESPVGTKTSAIETTTTDVVMDVRYFLFRLPETCHFTSYHLEVRGVPLNDYMALAEYPAFRDAAPNESVLVKMVPDYYDQRASRAHVRKFREILASPPYQVENSTGPYFEPPTDADAAAAAPAAAGSSKKSRRKKKKKKGKQQEQENGAPAAPAPTDSKQDAVVAAVTRVTAQARHGDKAPLEVEQLLEPELARKRMYKPHECVQSVKYSSWNPPPGPRRLRGDLGYLVVHTLEDHVLHVTACAEGFYVNRSTETRFEPSPSDAPYRSHTLVGLLKQASPRFGERFHRLLSRKVRIHPLEDGEVFVPHQAWLAPGEEDERHGADWNRAEASLTDSFGMDTLGVMRDWNEEYQGCREMPSAELDERILRDRTASRVYADFCAAATEGAKAVVEGNIVPVNPVENPRHQVWLFNNIFFSRPADPTERYVEHGDEIAHKLVNLDLSGVRGLAELDVPRLHVLAQCIVDYRGTRLLCQSVIPGIFHDKTSEHLYGSLNQGKHVVTDGRFHKLMSTAGAHMHLKEHPVVDGQDGEHNIFGAVDCKGMRGSEGRFYMVDLARLTPRDANFPDKVAHLAHCVRPELLSFYCRGKAFAQIMEQQKARAAAKAAEEEKKGGDGDDKAGDAAEQQQDEEVDLTNAAAESTSSDEDEAAAASAAEANTAEAAAAAEADEDEEKHATYLEALAAQRFNNDAFTGTKLGGTEEEQEADRCKLHDLARFVLEEAVPKLVHDIESMSVAPPVDTLSLTDLMHERGINMRYLGKVHEALGGKAGAEANGYVRRLVEREMVVRAAKHVFREVMAEVGPDDGHRRETWYAAPVARAFLNAFLGASCGGAGLTDDDLHVAERVLAARDQAVRGARESESVALQQNETLLMMDIEMHAAEGAAAAEAEAKAAEGEELPLPRVIPPVLTHLAPGAAAQAQAAPSKAPVLRHADGSRAHDSLTAPANLWQRVRAGVKARFGHELPERVAFDKWERLALLRAFCLRAGLRLRSRSYTLGEDAPAEPFAEGDVVDLFPVVKAAYPRSPDAEDLLTAARAALVRQEVAAARQYASESLYVMQMVVGHVHRLAVDIYSTLATISFVERDTSEAIEKQQAAVVVAERVLGPDHPETAFQHSQLAFYLLVGAMPLQSLKHAGRAMYLFRTLCGPNHPVTAMCHANLAAIFRQIGGHGQALEHIVEALRATSVTLGAQHVQTAHLQRSLALVLAWGGDFRGAVAAEKAAKEAYTAVLGHEHGLVKSCKDMMGQFTQLAVLATTDKKAAAQGTQRVPRLRWSPLRSELPYRGRLSMDDWLRMIETAAHTETAMVNARRMQSEQRRLQQRYIEALNELNPEAAKGLAGGVVAAAAAATSPAAAEEEEEEEEEAAAVPAEAGTGTVAEEEAAAAGQPADQANKKRLKNKRRRNKKKKAAEEQ